MHVHACVPLPRSIPAVVYCNEYGTSFNFQLVVCTVHEITSPSPSPDNWLTHIVYIIMYMYIFVIILCVVLTVHVRVHVYVHANVY